MDRVRPSSTFSLFFCSPPLFSASSLLFPSRAHIANEHSLSTSLARERAHTLLTLTLTHSRTLPLRLRARTITNAHVTVHHRCNQVGFYQEGAPLGHPTLVTRLVQPSYDEVRVFPSSHPSVFPSHPFPSPLSLPVRISTAKTLNSCRYPHDSANATTTSPAPSA